VRILKITFGIVAVLGILAAGGIYGVHWWNKSSQAAANEPLSVRVEPAAFGDLVEITSAPGIVQAKTKVSISAKVSARILEIPHKEGELVTKGDPDAKPPIPPSVLIKLDDKDLQAALRSAQARYAAQDAQIKVEEARIDAQKAQLESQRVALVDARRDLKRQVELLATKDVSQSVVDAAQVKLDTAQAQLNAAEKNLIAEQASAQVLKHTLAAADADVQKAREDLSNTVILSPIDGTVTKLNAEVGEMVVTGTMNNAGTVILEVGDLSQMMVVARVDETAIAEVAPGQQAIVRLPAYRNKSFEGEVVSVGLAATEDKDGTKYYKTEILLKKNPQQILTGLTADVDIETRRSNHVLKVPSQAVVGRPVDDLPSDLRNAKEVEKGKATVPVVYRYKDGKALLTPVAIGTSDLTHTIITSGVSEGDLVVTGPYKVLESIKHEQLVKPDRPTTQPSTRPTTLPATRP
jgi:HlyD family secretion protein